MDANNVTTERAARISVRRLMVTLLRVLDARAFRDLDAAARAGGWQVRRPAPFIRVYRARLVASCRICSGEGYTPRGLCRDCLGSGRVRSC